jgi:hypothetical protein
MLTFDHNNGSQLVHFVAQDENSLGARNGKRLGKFH